MAFTKILTRRDLVLLVLLLLAAAGTAMLIALAGGGRSTSHVELADAGRQAEVARIQLALVRTTLDGSEYGRTLRGVDRLIELCRADPSWQYTVGGYPRTMLQVVQDGANELRLYRPVLAAKLDRAAGSRCR